MNRLVNFCMSVLSFVVVMNAEAVTISSGADGIFQPATSVVLDSTQLILNFSSIYIPTGVTVSFSDQLSPQTYTFLATGDVDIAGVMDLGINSLRIETPESISISGNFLATSGSLSLFANSINLSGSLNTPGLITPIDSIQPRVGPLPILGGGVINLSPVPEPEIWAMLSMGLIFSLFVKRRQKLA
jgi:hypothetical protein